MFIHKLELEKTIYNSYKTLLLDSSSIPSEGAVSYHPLVEMQSLCSKTDHSRNSKDSNVKMMGSRGHSDGDMVPGTLTFLQLCAMLKYFSGGPSLKCCGLL